MPEEKVRLGVSACLLGEAVRWDGGHKRDAIVVELLGPRVTWVPVCPEVELGLGVPRPPIQLAGDARAPRLVVAETGADLTARMRRFAEARLDELARLGLDGYVLKARSPSCGPAGVPVHGTAGATGAGLFAAALAARFPDLPAEDEDGLADPAVRARFLERAVARARRHRV
ncbi:MAG TPA: DUF523 domain-containing protein [Methylomirabilota bacterium]|jgi:uncharacterized protein YbbK (DUF523 family)|nr:DUF523 domain-containing protein [Methylomirabilota bacterium]